jgi:hypothetical protein
MIKSKWMGWVGHVERTETKRIACRILVGKPEGKRPLGTPRRRSVDNIKIYLRERELGGMDWIDLAQDRDKWRKGSCEHGSEPSGFIKCSKILEQLHNWRLLKKGSAA